MPLKSIAKISLKFSVPLLTKNLDEITEINAKLKAGIAELASGVGIEPDQITVDSRIAKVMAGNAAQ